ncbi:Hypothetical protein A7982_06614 [Minicystis rosea]|nr:Hypothetical protein A7982_06614 [Minicystis rosea]
MAHVAGTLSRVQEEDGPVKNASRRTLLSTFAALGALALLEGCGPIVLAQGNPRPNMALTPKKKSLKLVLSDIQDDFSIPSRNGVAEVQVQQLQETLRAGFRNGFGDAYSLLDSTRATDMTLTLSGVELEVVPAAVSTRVGVVAATVQIRFKATLEEAGAVHRVAGTAESKKPAVSRDELTNVAESAIESMYEAIGQKLFADAPAH